MNIIISSTSTLPIYEQIKEQIIKQIFDETIKPHSPLPSIRSLAKDLGISVITTKRAYNDLEHDGFIATIQGKGTYVLPQKKDKVQSIYSDKAKELFTEGIKNARLAQLDEDEIKNMINDLLEG